MCSVCQHCLLDKFSNYCGRACDMCGEAAVDGCQIQTPLRFEDLPPSMQRRHVFCDALRRFLDDEEQVAGAGLGSLVCLLTGAPIRPSTADASRERGVVMKSSARSASDCAQHPSSIKHRSNLPNSRSEADSRTRGRITCVRPFAFLNFLRNFENSFFSNSDLSATKQDVQRVPALPPRQIQ